MTATEPVCRAKLLTPIRIRRPCRRHGHDYAPLLSASETASVEIRDGLQPWESSFPATASRAA